MDVKREKERVEGRVASASVRVALGRGCEGCEVELVCGVDGVDGDCEVGCVFEGDVEDEEEAIVFVGE